MDAADTSEADEINKIFEPDKADEANETNKAIATNNTDTFDEANEVDKAVATDVANKADGITAERPIMPLGPMCPSRLLILTIRVGALTINSLSLKGLMWPMS